MKQKTQWLFNGMIVIIIGLFIFFQLNLFETEKTGVSNGMEGSQNLDEEALFNEIEEQLKTNSKYPEKEKIVLKIRNTADYFQTLKGTYEIDDRDYGKMRFQYAIDVDNQKSIYQSDSWTTIWNGKEKEKTVFYETEKTYGVYPIIEPKEEGEKEQSSYVEKILGEARNEEYLAAASEIINSEKITFLIDFESWSFEETEFLNRPSIKLSGVIDPSESESLTGDFEWFIDKETGVTLDFKVFDDAGEVKYHIKTIEIQFNEPLDGNLFEKDTAGYKKLKRVKSYDDVKS